MQSALFVGRFQPFHKGHLNVIQDILTENERVIIVIGSAEKNFLPENPLTTGERLQIIETALQENKISAERYTIIPVRNVNNYALWVNHLNVYVPPYNKLYTGSEIVKACFLGKYNKTHRENKIGPEIINLKREPQISATEIRNLILENDNRWETLVSPSTAELLKTWNIAERLKIIQNTEDITAHNNSY